MLWIDADKSIYNRVSMELQARGLTVSDPRFQPSVLSILVSPMNDTD